MRAFVRATAIVALAAVAAFAGVGDYFIYFPVKYPSGDWDPQRHGLKVEDRALTAKDGVKLHAWLADHPAPRATLLLLHGNGGNVTYYARHMARLHDRLGLRILAVDYRGYGKSEGTPSEEGLYRDAEAAYDHCVAALGERPERIVIYGHSLGTGVAAELAMRRRAAALVLDAPFTSVLAMTRKSVPFVDPKRIVSERYDTLDKVPRLDLPLLVIHGARDRTIPVAMGREVFAAACEPKEYLEVEGGAHSDCASVAAEAYFGAFERLLERALQPAPAPAQGRDGF